LKYFNILIVGFGSIGKKHHSIIKKKFKKFKILIISKHLKTKLQFKNLKTAKFSKAIICTPATDHIKNILEIIKLNRKIDLMVEKPLSDKIIKNNNILKIKSFLKSKNSKLQVGYCLRYHPITEFLKKFVKKNDNEILETSIITNSYLPNWRKGDYKKQVSSKKELGGGVLNELSHELDLMIYLYGNPEKVISNVNNSKLLDINVEDNANILFYYKKISHVSMHLDFNSFIERQIIEIKTKKYFLIADFIKKKILIKSKNSYYEKYFKLKENEIYYNQLKDFLTFKKSNSIDNLKSSNNITKMIYEIKKSHRLGKIINLR